MKIGILTTFSNFKSEYSLTTVVKQQLEMLVKYDYEVTLFVLSNFNIDDLKNVPKKVKVLKAVPQLILEPYSAGSLDNLDKDVETAQKAFEESLVDIDVCLTHDIIFINSYLPYNIALRNAIETKLGKVKWLHWMHSGPSFADLDGSPWDNLRTLPKNSLLVYMNYTDALRAAEMFHTSPNNVRTISNPMDMRSLFNFDPITKKLIDDYDLMSVDILTIYPLSTTRMGFAGKQLDKALRIMGELKKNGQSVAIVIPNAHANAQKEKQAIEDMYSLAHSFGLERREVIFTSLIEPPKYEQGMSHDVVRDLFLLSNVFIFPSYSENCPLVLLEAMAGGNILVLNEDFPAMKDFAGHNALYFRFSSTVAPNPDFPRGISNYYRDISILIIGELDKNKAIKAKDIIRKKFNIDYIFKRQLESAILELYYGK